MRAKRKWIPAALAVLLIGAGLVLASPYLIGKSFGTLLTTDSSHITQVHVKNGMTGYGVVTTDPSRIRALIRLMDNRRYRRSFDQRPKTGYLYRYDFFVGSKIVLSIDGVGSNVSVNGVYCHVDRPISADALKSWFDSAAAAK